MAHKVKLVGAGMTRAQTKLATVGLMLLALSAPSTFAQPRPTAPPPPSIEATPPGCHWSERGDGQSTLWCKDASGEFHKTDRVQASNLGVGDGCPDGQFYNGEQCVGALRPASGRARAPLTPTEQAENRTFLTGLAKSLDEVVTLDSASWVINRYDRGSMTNAKTLAHGADRRSALVYGEYTFNGGRHGWVKGRIANGQYTCLEYWDGTGCRPLGHPESHKVVAGLLFAMFAGAMSGGGGGSHDSGRREEIFIHRQEGSSPSYSAPSYEPAPITPIGGDRGLYGADHSCCSF